MRQNARMTKLVCAVACAAVAVALTHADSGTRVRCPKGTRKIRFFYGT